MELTARQYRFLRGLGQSLEPTLRVGKEGLSPGVLRALEELLDHHELIKVRVQKAAEGKTPAEWAAAMAESSGAAIVGVVGFTCLLYRPNPTLKDAIELPE
jgi:RNA-binding protein